MIRGIYTDWDLSGDCKTKGKGNARKHFINSTWRTFPMRVRVQVNESETTVYILYIHMYMRRDVLGAQSCPMLCDPMDCSPPDSSVCGIFLGKNAGVGGCSPPSRRWVILATPPVWDLQGSFHRRVQCGKEGKNWPTPSEPAGHAW